MALIHYTTLALAFLASTLLPAGTFLKICFLAQFHIFVNHPVLQYLFTKSMCHLRGTCPACHDTESLLGENGCVWAGTVPRARVAAKLFIMFIEEEHYDDTSIRADLNTI